MASSNIEPTNDAVASLSLSIVRIRSLQAAPRLSDRADRRSVHITFFFSSSRAYQGSGGRTD
eukprot:scaffold266426_cov48-Attheya_sp.AAC.1